MFCLVTAARMHPLQVRVQLEPPRPLSCAKRGTSKAKIGDLPEKYIVATSGLNPVHRRGAPCDAEPARPEVQ